MVILCLLGQSAEHIDVVADLFQVNLLDKFQIFLNASVCCHPNRSDGICLQRSFK